MNYSPPCDVLFGTAYKGIQIAIATSLSLYKNYNLHKPYSFNRKEIKKHGEYGEIIGNKLIGDIVMVDDVITEGGTINQAAKIIKQYNAKLTAVILSLDRQEKCKKNLYIKKEIENNIKCKIFSIITFNDLIKYLKSLPKMSKYYNIMKNYSKNK